MERMVFEGFFAILCASILGYILMEVQQLRSVINTLENRINLISDRIFRVLP